LLATSQDPANTVLDGKNRLALKTFELENSKILFKKRPQKKRQMYFGLKERKI